jgi:membrane-associated phospholipid phosphatase
LTLLADNKARPVRCLAIVDATGVRLVRALPHPLAADSTLIGLSRATDHSDAWLALGLLGALFDGPRRGRWLNAASRIALVELSSRAVKRMLPRDRPRLQGLPPLAPTPSPMSFPSSHTAVAVAAVYSFHGLLPHRLLQALALTTAFSRLYLGVHFPSDVAAGAWLGRVVGGCMSTPVGR